MKKIRISALVMARNEQGNIAEAVECLGFADQIVVVDTGSVDGTVEVARKAGAEVHQIEFDGFGKSKNTALQYCSGEWIFSMDADERVSEELAQSILKQVQDNSALDGYLVNRLSYFLGKPVKHSGWFPDYILRLYRKDRGAFSNRLVHERVQVNGDVGKLDGLLHHFSYGSLDQYIEKMNVYSSLNARELLEQGRRWRLIDLLIHPPATFMKMYLLKSGFLDGVNGLILAALSSYHVFVKYVKLRQLCQGDQ